MALDDKSFFDLCYDQYKVENDETASIYSVAAFALTGLTVVGAAIAALARSDWLNHSLKRLDVSLFYSALVAAALLLVVAVIRLAMCATPRHGYKALRSITNLREDFKDADVSKHPDYARLTGLLCQCHAANRELNEHRRSHLQATIRVGSWSLAMLFAAAFFHAIVTLVGQ